MRISDWSSDVCSSDLNFLDVIGGREINDRILTGILEHRMLEVDVEGEPITFVRLESCPLVTILHLQGLANGQELLRLILLVNAGGLTQEQDRKSVGKGKSVSVRVDLGGGRYM